jgi:hypothetical protein
MESVMTTNFDINTVNGVVFASGSLFDPGSATYTAGHYAKVMGAGLERLPAGSDFTAYVIDDTYTAPISGSTLPVFGQIELVSSFSGGERYYANVIGYTDDSLLLGRLSGTRILYTNFFSDNVTSSGVTVLSDSPAASTTFPLKFTDNGPFTPPCFAQGVQILTARGEVAVEDLAVGDAAITASGDARPVIWIGSRRVRCDRHPSPAEVNPVRIRKGAFGDRLPHSDLVVSPGHAVFVDGVLIPAHALINGATIIQEQVERIRYFHVELDAHDVLLAEGLPCESYLDDGNRTSFGNSPGHVALHGRLDPKSWEHACAPMVAAGPQLAEVQRRLLARAEAMGWTRMDEPDLQLMADGVPIAPVMVKGDRLWFAAPAAAELVLVSSASVLAHTLPGVVDLRRLGVAISALKIDGQSLDLASPAFGQGFHAQEAHGDHAWRWTDGEGRLAVTLAEPAILEVAVLMVAPAWKRPAAKLRLVEAR